MSNRINYGGIDLCKLMLCFLFTAGVCTKLSGQTVQAWSQNYVSISDTSQLINGASFPVVFKVAIYGGNGVTKDWKLTVQPTTAYLIPAQTASEVANYGTAPNWPIKYFGLKYNQPSSDNSWSNNNSSNLIGAVSSVIELSGSELDLVTQSAYDMVGNDYFTLAYDFRILGNRQMLLLHRDNYSVVFRFRLYKKNGALLGQYDLNYQLGIWPQYGSIPQNVPQYSNSLTLQNGANNIALSFANTNDFAVGVEATVNDGLKVSSADGRYEIKVQSVANYFSKSGAITTVPVSTIRLTPSQGSTTSTSTYTPVNLSTTQSTIITNLGTAGGLYYYNLNYSTKQNPNQSAFIGVPEGAYETQVTYIMNPL